MICADTSALICLIERIEPARSLFLNHLRTHQGIVMVSSFAIAECMAKPIASGAQRLVRDYDDFFASEECHVIPVSSDIARKAAELRGVSKKKLGDAVHLATAVIQRAATLVTTDSDFGALAKGTDVSVILLPRTSD